jgi:hypothetical protein
VRGVQQYVIKFVSDFFGFLQVLWFPPPKNLTAPIITEILNFGTIYIYINKINDILFAFCPADAAIVATIALSDICMIYRQHLTPKST